MKSASTIAVRFVVTNLTNSLGSVNSDIVAGTVAVAVSLVAVVVE